MLSSGVVVVCAGGTGIHVFAEGLCLVVHMNFLPWASSSCG
jgi:carbamate kinase